MRIRSNGRRLVRSGRENGFAHRHPFTIHAVATFPDAKLYRKETMMKDEAEDALPGTRGSGKSVLWFDSAIVAS
jgi:hypothetical protein